MSPVSAVGFELLSLTGDVMFDNILVSDSLEVARRWTEDTWGQRKTVRSTVPSSALPSVIFEQQM